MPWMVGAAIAAPIVAGAVGSAMSAGDRQAALDLQKQALQNLQNVNSPDAQSLKLALQQYSAAGQLAPQMEQLIQQQPSVLANIQTDPRLANAQNQALDTLQKIGQGGLRPEDQAALAQVRNQVETQENANRQAILQNMQQRGIGGSGAELAAQLSNSQSAANRANASDLDIAGQASQRALQAIYSGGTLGQSMQAQQFNQAAQKANAQDVINRYNAMNSQQVSNTNTGYLNNAQAQNLSNAQAIKNANTGVANQQAQYNAMVPQQVFNNAVTKATGQVNQSNALAGSYNNNAAATQATGAGIGQAAGQGATAGLLYSALQKKAPVTPAAATSNQSENGSNAGWNMAQD